MKSGVQAASMLCCVLERMEEALACTEFPALGWLRLYHLCHLVALDTPVARALLIDWQDKPLYHTVQLAQKWTPALLNRGHQLLPQEEKNAGRMSSFVADKSFPMNPC